MDHLPLPQHPTIRTFDIPFVCINDYDGGELLSYPERCRWTASFSYGTSQPFFHHDGVAVSDEYEQAAFLQTWLYFGLIYAVTGEFVDVSAFWRLTEQREIVLDSSKLEHIVAKWTWYKLRQSYQIFETDLLDWFNYLSVYFIRASGVVRTFLGSAVDSCLTRVCIGIAVLGEYLQGAILAIFRARSFEQPDARVWFTHEVFPITRIMSQNGWCPRLLAHISRSTKLISTLWYFANIDPPYKRKWHGDCTSTQCQWSQVDHQDYRTLHKSDACRCSSAGPQPSQLAEIVISGKTPLITVDRDLPSNLAKVTVRAYTGQEDFIAISHVWADGRGNLRLNDLPSCVLFDLQARVDKLSLDYLTARKQSESHTPFWIDTLCLPRHPLSLRRKAILTLDEPFRKASKVLVLHSYLEAHKLEQATSTETIARLSLSPWTHRLWTFCEGQLATSSWIQLFHGALNPALATRYWYQNSPIFPTFVQRTVHSSILGSFNALNFGAIRERLSIRELRYALKIRATSWPFDEPICLAILLELDVSAVVRATDMSKMQTLWSLMSTVPAWLVFSRASAKLQSPGFHWAPTTLIGHIEWETDIGFDHIPHAIRSDNGLIIELKALLFKATQLNQSTSCGKTAFIHSCIPPGENDLTMNSRMFGIQDEHDRWYICHFERAWNQSRTTQASDCDEPIILLAESSSMALVQNNANVSLESKLLTGIFGTYSKTGMNTDALSVKIHSHVTLELCTTEEAALRDALRTCAKVMYTEQHEEISKLRDSLLDLQSLTLYFIDDYPLKPYLMRLGRDVIDSRLGAGFVTDAEVQLINAEYVTYFLLIDSWYLVEETSTLRSYCVD